MQTEQLAARTKHGELLEIQPEDVEAVEFSHYDCWSESGDEDTPQFDWEDSRAIQICQSTLSEWSKTLNIPGIHPDILRGDDPFDLWYLNIGTDRFGNTGVFSKVIPLIIAAGYSVYDSENFIEVYESTDLQ